MSRLKESYTTMSNKELSRLEMMERIASGRLTQIDASKILKLSRRQVGRLVKAHKQHGAKGLISKRRGKPSNNQLDPTLKARSISLIKEHYYDFGPTLAKEKLAERHSLMISKETTRQLMISAGLWKVGKKRRTYSIHQMRERRPCFGDLIQIDGSAHDWFEGRAEKCCLLVFIDDATGELTSLHFVEQECTQGYFDATRQHIESHGIPVSFYSDKHGIFRVNTFEAKSGNGETQFSRAAKELGIELINAHTPQAKGRVERMNAALQDRLIKELRLEGISDIQAANAFLPTFIKSYNKKFAKMPASSADAHRNCTFTETQLNQILSHRSTRKISKNLEISYHSKILQIQTTKPSYAMRGAAVTITDQKGYLTIWYKGKKLPFKTFNTKNKPTRIADAKEINKIVSQVKKKPYKPAITHPWKKGLLTMDQKQNYQQT